jgi:hypothetical protein
MIKAFLTWKLLADTVLVVMAIIISDSATCLIRPIVSVR